MTRISLDGLQIRLMGKTVKTGKINGALSTVNVKRVGDVLQLGNLLLTKKDRICMVEDNTAWVMRDSGKVVVKW